MKTLKRACACFVIVLFITAIAYGVWDKDKPAAGTSLRSSNPEILANNTALQTAIDAEHDFGDSTQTGSHTPGSARAFFQDAAPTTQIDGHGFAQTDLGSLWFDTDSSIDNQFHVLTATTPTWTPVSTEIMAFMLASGRVFGSTLGVTGDFAVNTNKFQVTAASGNTLVAGTLDVTGNIDPTTYETTNGGFLDEDNMASDAADKVASQQSIKAYAEAALATQATASIFGTRTTLDTVAGTLAVTSIYRAQCDGFLVGYAGAQNAYVVVYVEPSDTSPDTALYKDRNYGEQGTGGGFMVPVKKDDYVQVTTSSGAAVVYWQPIGTGGLVKQ